MSADQPTIHKRIPYHDDELIYHDLHPLLSSSPDEVIEFMKMQYSKKPQTTRALALHCIHTMFEHHTDTHIKKETAYEDFKFYYEKMYPSTRFSAIGFPQFGKLMKIVHRCTTRRMGSRTGAKYCYSNVRLSAGVMSWFEEHRPKISKRISFLDESTRFHIIITPLNSGIDDVFEQFLYNEFMDYKRLDVSNDSMSYLLAMLAKSDMLFKNFIHLLSQDGVFDQFISDWYNYGITDVIAQTVNIVDVELLSFISSFPLVLDNEAGEPHNYFNDQKMPFVKFFKLEFTHQKANSQKLKMLNFLVELLTRSPKKSSLPTFILNFKYVTTSVLRHLTLQNAASFSTYWVLGCFLDEFTQFLIEYYAFRKDSKKHKPIRVKEQILEMEGDNEGST